ncbi:DUF4846 domain-containing protein [Clostridium cylindrosporum]|uniref:DUF4846 domain-containing protein n=1 Tax=Clostridium cylindrosporum DSM 605 TaxID=1121307 RepID=A0A0J8D4H1_CLOCY|nr:DUF4846 domain-containing protein [Clostridium cylindrosporum]KMT21060.1 hypothetical protein CLCY_1c02940 [Clostridium cylindrosporum DSM 605]
MKRLLLCLIYYLSFILLLVSCSNKIDTNNTATTDIKQDLHPIINEKGSTTQERFNTPVGYRRTKVEDGSFQEYLRNFPLKPNKTEVKYFDGRVKKNYNVYEAVMNIDVGDKDLQQCADAVMRLRAEYLYNKKMYEDIHFNFVSGFNAKYSKWMEGYRISMIGDNASWIKKTNPSTDYKSFRKYLDIVFSYAGTASLHKELKTVKLNDMKIGDILIQTGNPYGHAVIVVDMAENNKGEKVFMLAQSYMPAQDIQILCNRNNKKLSPWYKLDSNEFISTPQWKFTRNDLKRF